MPTDDGSRLVYRTGIGRVRYCSRCHQPEQQCRCRQEQGHGSARAGARQDGKVRIFRQKGRGGSVVSAVNGVPGDPELLHTLAQTLKRHVAAGGAVKGGEILIQGDHREKLAAKLRELGYTVVLAGG